MRREEARGRGREVAWSEEFTGVFPLDAIRQRGGEMMREEASFQSIHRLTRWPRTEVLWGDQKF